MAKNDRDNDTVHGKKAKMGIFVSTPTYLVKGRGSGTTACNEI